MITELFHVTVDVPTRIDMDTSDFEEQFMLVVKGSIESGSDPDSRYVYADFTSFHEAQECEYKLKTIMRA